VPDPADKKRGQEVVVAVDAATGKTRWEHRYPVAMLPKQETFRGDPIGPQATPLLHAGRLVALGYAGLLHALDPATGKVLWRHDVVADYGATPVQFGFSGSPVAHNDTVLVHVGGKQAAVIAFAASDGAVRWKSEPAEPSYATPVLTAVAGEEQVVQVTRDHILGLAATDGATRWKYDLKVKGYTNVPTPLPLPGDRLLVSGQGIVGTRLLKLTRDAAAEVWAVKQPQWFYFNWLPLGDVAVGYPDKTLTALRLGDGEVAWKAGGLLGGTLVAAGGECVRLREDGQLARLTLTAEAAGEAKPLAKVEGRCWTPPAVAGGVVYARSNKELVAVRP
jgi:outer membrane protein assembly factor BamB